MKIEKNNEMDDGKLRVCPLELAGSLDNRLRRWAQNPRRILGPYIKAGMTVLDFGCGPGFFSIDIARMVGRSGRVIAADLQEGMLQKIRNKIRGTELEPRMTLHKCRGDGIGLAETVDFILAFYAVHEISDKGALFNEMSAILKPNGRLFIVEPPLHVSKKGFEETIGLARTAGFEPVLRPRVFLSKAAILKMEKG